MFFASPAKLNLSLNVGTRRPDGYHDVSSIFHLVGLHDTLTLTPADNFTLTCDVDLKISIADNLITRAATAMAELYNRVLPAYRFHLTKRIPHGAGLGGGSSNAATTIYALSKIWGVRPDSPENLELAAGLGSDVALFLAPTTASFMTGKGEHLAESFDPIAGLPIVIVHPPGAHSPTAAVYQAFNTDPQPADQQKQDTLIKTLRQGSLTSSSLAPLLHNNLEDAAITVSPSTGKALDWLRVHPATQAALVAGSGSACWVLCATQAHARQLAADARSIHGYHAWETTTTATGIIQLD